jgi:hypothetical protein
MIASRSVQFNEEVEVKTLVEAIGGPSSGPVEAVEISEERIDYVMHLLHEADPVSFLSMLSINKSALKKVYLRIIKLNLKPNDD